MRHPDDDAVQGRTKLICTIGPSTAHRIDELAAAGMDVARINLSHGTPGSHAAAAIGVRRTAAAYRRPLGLLVDLAGPKVRLGDLVGGSVALQTGQPFILRAPATTSVPGDASGAQVSYGRLGIDVRQGDPILLADGAVELRVTSVDRDVRTEVVRGGTIRARAGVAIPAARLSSPAVTRKDRADARRAVDIGATHVGQSFVRGARDVVGLRRLLGPDGPPIVAKIETRPALESFDDIIEVADAVMIARGDLGVEVPYEEVPLIQKQLVRRALDRGVPTIVATQMLESMTTAPRPTRAEATDVANAVFDGADAIMLSGETAIGAYPVEAASAAARIAHRCERQGAAYLPEGMPRASATDGDALAYAAVTLASAHAGIAAVCCYTRTGRTARVLASLRPRVPIIAFSPDTTVIDRLTLVNAVVPRPCDALDRAGDRIGSLGRMLDESRLVDHGATVILVGAEAGPSPTPDLLGVHVRS